MQPIVGSMSEAFSGPMGALVMSMIAMSIVFLVIMGLMVVMYGVHKFADAIEARKACATGAK